MPQIVKTEARLRGYLRFVKHKARSGKEWSAHGAPYTKEFAPPLGSLAPKPGSSNENGLSCVAP